MGTGTLFFGDDNETPKWVDLQSPTRSLRLLLGRCATELRRGKATRALQEIIDWCRARRDRTDGFGSSGSLRLAADSPERARAPLGAHRGVGRHEDRRLLD